MCPFIKSCKRTLRLDYVGEHCLSRNWCDRAGVAKKEHLQGCDIVISEEIENKLLSGEVISLVVTVNDCVSTRKGIKNEED